jgi:hypothetical protein
MTSRGGRICFGSSATSSELGALPPALSDLTLAASLAVVGSGHEQPGEQPVPIFQ